MRSGYLWLGYQDEEMAKLMFLPVIGLLVTIIALAKCDTLKITPDNKELLLKIGTAQELNCYATASSGTELVWIYPVDDGKKIEVLTKVLTTVTSGESVYNSSLTISKFDLSLAGEFKCRLRKNNITSDEKFILLTAVQENKTEVTFAEDMTSATLSCVISFESNKSITNNTWMKINYKDNVPVYEVVANIKDKNHFERVNNSLVINNPTRDDAGGYIARYKFQDLPNSYDCHVDFYAMPFVQNFDKSKNLIEGDKMELQCVVKGHPTSKITWYKNNVPLNTSNGDNRHQVLESFDGHQTVRLLIKSVEFSDEGDYTCEAYSVKFNETSKKTLTVSVKDKLAALWPFLGIVCEVVVLCTIIFIYEKRRNTQVQLEEKAAEEVDGSATDKKEGLRHRTGNNPTA